MKLLVLTEGGSNVGFGHVTRTAAIAKAVQKQSPRSEIKFVVSGDAQVKKYAKPLGLSIQLEAWLKNGPKLKRWLRDADAVLIDSYKPTLSFCKKISAINSRCFWLDDYGRLSYPAGTVITPGPYNILGSINLPKQVRRCFGKDYVILRDAFNKNTNGVHIRKDVRNILILLGGTGNISQVKKIMTCLNDPEKSFKFVWVAPYGSPGQRIPRLTVKRNISAEKLIRLMLKSDLAVSSAGQTLYELAAVGLPALALKTAENQNHNITALKKSGFLMNSVSGLSPKSMTKIQTLFKQIQNPIVRRNLSLGGLNSVSRNGASRIARLLLRGNS